MFRLVVLTLVGLVLVSAEVPAASDQHWAVQCPPTRPLAANQCRVSPTQVEGQREFSVLFSYMGEDLNFLISGEQKFTHGEVRIDGKHIFMTQLCGKGYCVFSGHLAEELAMLFRKGRRAEIELVTRKRNVTMTQQVDLAGFEVAFNKLPGSSR